MNTNEQSFDRFTKLAELAAKRFDTRREFEWKIILGFWAAIMAAVYKTETLPSVGVCRLLIVAAIVILCFILTWIRGVWIANQNDKRRYEYYFAKAETAAGEQNSSNPSTARLTNADKLLFILDWNSQFQILVTTALVALFVFGSATKNSQPNRKVTGATTQSTTADRGGNGAQLNE